jgi:hypothetical protein
MPSIRSYISSPFKKSKTLTSRKVRLVHSPKLIHHHLQLEENAPTGETIREVIENIENSMEADQQTYNLVVAIDITCQPDLIAEGFAPQLAQSVLLTLDEHFPWLRDRFVGISDDETCLPLHDLMRTGKLTWEEIDNQHRFVFE